MNSGPASSSNSPSLTINQQECSKVFQKLEERAEKCIYINLPGQTSLNSSPEQKDTRKLGTILCLDYNYIFADFEPQLTSLSIDDGFFRRGDNMISDHSCDASVSALGHLGFLPAPFPSTTIFLTHPRFNDYALDSRSEYSFILSERLSRASKPQIQDLTYFFHSRSSFYR